MRSDVAEVTDGIGLAEPVAAARAAGIVGLDTEFMRERTYRARLCLVQVAAGERTWLIDPLADLDLKPLAELIAEPEVEVVVHAGRQDLEIFYERFGVIPERVFDVQLAAGFVGLGSSLPYGRLVEEVTGVSLTKGDSYTEWCRRPLTESQKRYAADDVIYLVEVATRLKERLEQMGRSEWAQEEMALLESPAEYRVDPRDAWRKIGGRGSLSPRAAAVLREIAAWREETAARRDLPRGWVLKDPTLIEIARRGPRSHADLSSIRGMATKEVDRSGREIIDAVARGRGAEPINGPRRPPAAAQARARVLVGIADAVVRKRCDAAGIAPGLVATRAELEAVLLEVAAGTIEEQDHRLLSGWRRDLAGNAVLALARGEIAVRAIDSPPYIEEIPLDPS